MPNKLRRTQTRALCQPLPQILLLPPRRQALRKFIARFKIRRSKNYIGEAETFITTVKTDAEINPVMTAAAAFGVRLAGIGGKTEKDEELMTGEAQVRGDYAAFRSVARAAFPA